MVPRLLSVIDSLIQFNGQDRFKKNVFFLPQNVDSLLFYFGLLSLNVFNVDLEVLINYYYI